jgi:ribosome biogenesis GTPase A
MSDIGDQLVAEDDEQQGREQQEHDWVQYLKDKLVGFHSKVSSYGTNIATARGIQKLSSEFEILVFGPARVGKSTLIKEISGDATIVTSADMNACTKTSEKYLDKFNIQWWDTPGNRPFYRVKSLYH